MKLEKLQFVVEDGVGIITMNYMKNLNAIDDCTKSISDVSNDL